jgi:hypothetical protein
MISSSVVWSQGLVDISLVEHFLVSQALLLF